MIFANFLLCDLVSFNCFFLENKNQFISRQKILWQDVIHNIKSGRVRRTFTLFLQRKQKKCGFCDNYDNFIHYKKLKYIRQCLDEAYYFSSQKDAPWQPTCWKVFSYHQIDKEFENI